MVRDGDDSDRYSSTCDSSDYDELEGENNGSRSKRPLEAESQSLKSSTDAEGGSPNGGDVDHGANDGSDPSRLLLPSSMVTATATNLESVMPFSSSVAPVNGPSTDFSTNHSTTVEGLEGPADSAVEPSSSWSKLPPSIQKADFSAVRQALGGGRVRFPWKLYQLLLECESNKETDIIAWLPCGTAFKVLDKERFTQVIMPRFFHSNKYKTFQRSLNVWGFESVGQGFDKGAVFHSYFRRGRMDLCKRMVRQSIKDPTCPTAVAAAAAAALNAGKEKVCSLEESKQGANDVGDLHETHPPAVTAVTANSRKRKKELKQDFDGTFGRPSGGSSTISLSALSSLKVKALPSPQKLSLPPRPSDIIGMQVGTLIGPSAPAFQNQQSIQVLPRTSSNSSVPSSLVSSIYSSQQPLAQVMLKLGKSDQSVEGNTASTASPPPKLTMIPMQPASFVERLHAVLEDPAIDCLRWRPHGRCFEIANHEQLERNILRPIFRLNLVEEFEAELARYGVYQIRSGRDAGCYYHDLLIRGLPHLCRRMKTPDDAHPDPTDIENTDFYNDSGPCARSTKPTLIDSLQSQSQTAFVSDQNATSQPQLPPSDMQLLAVLLSLLPLTTPSPNLIQILYQLQPYTQLVPIGDQQLSISSEPFLPRQQNQNAVPALSQSLRQQQQQQQNQGPTTELMLAQLIAMQLQQPSQQVQTESNENLAEGSDTEAMANEGSDAAALLAMLLRRCSFCQRRLPNVAEFVLKDGGPV